MAERFNECVFCRSANSGLWRGANFYVLLDIAPMMEGHLLICSADHYPSAADLSAEAATELDTICAWLRSLYLHEYGVFTGFEHGRTGHCVRLTPDEHICHHAHIHVLPLAADLAGRIRLSQPTNWQDWRHVAELGEDLAGYLVIDSTVSGRVFYPVTRGLPPHYLRTEVGELIGAPERADWERAAALGASHRLVERTRRRLAGAMATGIPNAAPR